jgi:hypothetical protein
MPTSKIRRPTIEMICGWVISAWNMVSPEVITNGFLKTGILTLLMEVKMICSGLKVKMWMRKVS